MRPYLVAALIAILFFSSSSARATHCAGGEITYEWVSDSTYKFTLHFYRDCSSTLTSSPATICYYNADGTRSGSFALTQVGTATEVSPGCPGFPTTCTQITSSLPGYREHILTATFTLPGRSNWTFYTYLSARNGALNYTGQPNFYVDATLDNTQYQGYSSPVFSVPPVPYVCVNQPYAYNNGAVDPNSDSLAFEMVSPRAASGCAANSNGVTSILNAPYNLTNNPFASSNSFVLSPISGQMNFTPSIQGAWALAVKVKKYRHGQLLSTIVRDMQMQVIPCNSAQPTLTTIASSIVGATLDNAGVLQACANSSLSFCFNSTSSSANPVLVATDNHAIATPGATLSYTGQATGSITGCFSWTPNTNDTGLKALTITIKDSTCLPPGILMSQTFTIPINIRPATITKVSASICPRGSLQLVSGGASNVSWHVLGGGAAISSLSCTSCASPVATPDVNTVYFASSTTLMGCGNVDTVSVAVDHSTFITITPTDSVVLCRPGLMQLDANVTGLRPFKNLACTIAPSVPATPLVQVEVKPYLIPQQNGNGSLASPLIGNRISARHQYLVHASDMKRAGMFSGTIKSLAFKFLSSLGSSVSNVKIALKCTPLTALDQNSGFEGGMIPVYNSASTVNIPAAGGFVSFDFPTLYNWDTTQNLIIDICYSNAVNVNMADCYYANTSYPATLYSFSNTGSICNGGIGSVAAAQNQLPVMRFEYYEAPESEAWTYKWDHAVYEPSANIKSPEAYISVPKNIYVHTIDRYGCVVSDTLYVYLPTPEMLSKDTSICEGTTVDLVAKNAQYYQWYEDGFVTPATLSCAACAVTTAKPSRSTRYYLITTDHGCLDTFSVYIKLTPYPALKILTADTVVKYGTYVQLRSTGADKYYWYPQQYLSDPLLSNPVASAVEPMYYHVIGIADSNRNCLSYDSVRVSIDYSDPVMIPTAFTPNGDNLNDVFRIVNLTFRKIQEFRIFDRWGKEVYTDDGTNKGWDGRLNGRDQEIGVYNYIIRIASPDGIAQVYKGDVTLIR
ncbi:gliding motility-associated C-terminal domain-containing protein [Taibaiella soli]|nr:gliding motility-associated C-terminal domain-containing protein [Taibaiella soli]